MPGSEKSERRPSRPRLSSLSFKNLRKAEVVSDKRQSELRSCIVCVGSTGTGKSSTISRVTGADVRTGAGAEPVTDQCQLYSDQGGQVWVDTVGWEDRFTDNTNIFQETLRFLNSHDLLKISAIVWCVAPNIRQDSTLQKQAEFINDFLPKNIWENVIILCKQSLNPAIDANGAVRAGQSFHKTAQIKLLGYRYLDDPSFTDEQRQNLEQNEETRRTFNVLTNSEIVTILKNTLDTLPSPVQVVFRDQKCVDCGEQGDRRLLSQYCHLQKCLKHPGRLQRIHPGGLELYHLTNDLVSQHPGQLRSPWYLGCVSSAARKWSCCKKSEMSDGCKRVFVCCRKDMKDEGCRKRYRCCKLGTDFGSGGAGCELIYNCCRLGPDIEGCVEHCVKCGRRWGTAALKCFKKDHNLINIDKT